MGKANYAHLTEEKLRLGETPGFFELFHGLSSLPHPVPEASGALDPELRGH